MPKKRCQFRLLLLVLTSAAAACTHTPPGTSVEVALAKKPEVVRLPQEIAAANAPKPSASTTVSAPVGSGGGGMITEAKTVRVADAYSRGEFCLQAGNLPEAINAFQEVVKLDPHFPGAWQHLAALYEQTGKAEEAMEAYRKSKEVPQ